MYQYMSYIRHFEREETQEPCAIIIENKRISALMQNFSRMGAKLLTAERLPLRQYVVLIYRTERNELVRMLAYVVHSSSRGNYFISGLHFIGVEGRQQ